MEQYNLAPLVHNSYVLVKIQKGMYSLPQAGLIAYKQLVKHLAKYGYHPKCRTQPLDPQDLLLSLFPFRQQIWCQNYRPRACQPSHQHITRLILNRWLNWYQISWTQAAMGLCPLHLQHLDAWLSCYCHTCLMPLSRFKLLFAYNLCCVEISINWFHHSENAKNFRNSSGQSSHCWAWNTSPTASTVWPPKYAQSCGRFHNIGWATAADAISLGCFEGGCPSSSDLSVGFASLYFNKSTSSLRRR